MDMENPIKMDDLGVPLFSETYGMGKKFQHPTDSRVTFVLGSGVHAEIGPGHRHFQIADLRKSYTP